MVMHGAHALRARGRVLKESMIGGVTTETFVIIICSILGGLLLIILVLMIWILVRRHKRLAAIKAYDDPVAMQKAAAAAAARAQAHLGMPPSAPPTGSAAGNVAPVAGAPTAPDGPHPALVQQQLQWEFMMQQHAASSAREARSIQELALSASGPGIDAAVLAERLVKSGQPDAAMAVATAAGIKHLVPGVVPVPAGHAAAAQGSNVGYYAGMGRAGMLPPMPEQYRTAAQSAGGSMPVGSPASTQALATYPVQWSPSYAATPPTSLPQTSPLQPQQLPPSPAQQQQQQPSGSATPPHVD